MIFHLYVVLVRGDLANIIQILSAPALIVGVIGVYRKINCHDPKCWHIGRYPSVDGKGWHYCKIHHRDSGVHK